MTQSAETGDRPPSPGGQIQWLPWGADAFRQAQERETPVLLSIGAVWCYWCHVMDETTYTDPDVAAYVNQHFVPVRVDNDHRPDVNARYNVGGWPSTVFLTGHGGYAAGATYLPPDQLLAMLMEVERAYQEQKSGLYDQANSLLRQRREETAKVSAGAELTPDLVDRMARRVMGAYDARNGGFGESPKFPSVPVLDFLLHLYRVTQEGFYREALEKTLNAMLDGEFTDRVDGGFFRYCSADDWTQPQHEKMLEDQIGLARVFMDASLLLGEKRYRRAAEGAVDYLLTSLYDFQASGFRGSQGAHSDYFGLAAEARANRPAPPVDPHCYAGWSAQAASLLLEASWKLGRPDLVEPARRVLDNLGATSETGYLSHVYTADGGLATDGGQLLTDWAHLLSALVDAANLSGGLPGNAGEKYLVQARNAASLILERFYDPARGGFFDIENVAEPVGYLAVREKPLPENIAAVQGLLKLHQATGDDALPEAARRTLSAFAEANRGYGEFAAGYALSVDHLLNDPLEVGIEGHPESPETLAMIQAAVNLSHPNVVLKFTAAPTGMPAQAHVCLQTVCWPPVNDPDGLAPLVAEALAPQESPFADIFQQFAG